MNSLQLNIMTACEVVVIACFLAFGLMRYFETRRVVRDARKKAGLR